MSSPEPTPDVRIDLDNERGYARSEPMQQAFDAAAEHLRQTDGYVDPLDPEHSRQLRADLALEGGGVKGIGLAGAVLVLNEAGYSFPRVAGTSVGAIAACLIASITKAKQPMTSLRTYLGKLQFANFMPEGKLHQFFDHQGGIVQRSADAAILTRQPGLYTGDYLSADPDWEPIVWKLNDPQRQTFWGAPSPASWFNEAMPVLGPESSSFVTLADPKIPDRPNYLLGPR